MLTPGRREGAALSVTHETWRATVVARALGGQIVAIAVTITGRIAITVARQVAITVTGQVAIPRRAAVAAICDVLGIARNVEPAQFIRTAAQQEQR